MNLFGFMRYLRLPRWRRWMRWPLYVIGVLALFVAVWVGGEILGWSVLLRLSIIGGFLGVVALVALIRWRMRRRKAREIEEALIVEPEGDGKVLAERMQTALATLKKSGGKTYLYDLPWYIIIGPPGAGKTTALKNSGIEFPLASKDSSGVEGFGGTRYCDWWFAEDAILIDTAGRYTTQDSDVSADKTSWQSFLDLLKRTRPNQPINGVILSFSVADMMEATPEDLTRQANIVRARLAEIHETLKIDFPVYVLFTKADLIAGFREYFSSFNLNRRKLVWGHTFQTKDRTAQTWEQVGAEYDRLVGRLSDEVMDRLAEEPDGISRIAIFGLPGQMALLRDNVAEFLRRVFEPTRYKTNAILRGFYFTSGTQEGTPIDQVLGAMAQNSGAGGLAPSFMSGAGKSFFLHDLLARVIFAEQDWVSHDRKAVRRTAILRGLALGVIGVVTAGALAALGISFWNNRQLVITAEAEAASYQRIGQEELARKVVDNSDLTPILDILERLRMQPAGYGNSVEPGWEEGFGLSQRERLEAAAANAYGDALEQMLRPRLLLEVESRLPGIVREGEPTAIYRALKVYMLLGGEGKGTDDAAIKAWFDPIWREQFQGLDGVTRREQLARHLEAMLALDGTHDLAKEMKPDKETVQKARSAIVQISLVDQAWSIIQDRAANANLPPLVLTEALGPDAERVFVTKDGKPLSEIGQPGLFRYEGFWRFFFDQLSVVREGLEADKWVLGEQADLARFDAQIAGLDIALQTRYQQEFVKSWNLMLDNIELANMVADAPQYDALGAASAPYTSPILKLVETVSGETSLMKELEDLKGMTPEQLMSGGGGNDTAEGVASDFSTALGNRFRSRSTGVQRMLLDALANNVKSQTRVNGATDSLTRPIEQIQEAFAGWHILLEDVGGQRPIDAILNDLEQIRANLRLAVSSPEQSASVLPQLLSNLTRNTSRLPAPVASFVNDAERNFRGAQADASLTEMNRELNNKIGQYCQANIASMFPFAQTQRQVPTSEFGKFFGPGGEMDQFYNRYLANMVIRTETGLTYDPNNELASRLSVATLQQFDRAEKIRRAFFAKGGTTPEVDFSVAQVSAHSSVEAAQLEINGQLVMSAAGDPPRPVKWPGQGASASIQIFPTLNRTSTISAQGGPWAIVQLFRGAASIQNQGNVTRATFNIGGRTITYDFAFDAVENPFTMRELAEFACPLSLD